MKSRLILGIFALLLFATGCGGGGGRSGVVATASRGALKVQIKWPARTRLVPQTADLVTFSVYSDAQLTQLVNTFTGQRPSSDSASSTWATSSTVYPIGTYYVQASAFAQSDTVHALADGVTQVQVGAGTTATFNVSLASTVSQFRLTGAVSGVVTLGGVVTGTPTIVVPAGGWQQPQTITVEPEDSTGSALVLLSTTGTLSLSTSNNLSVTGTGTVNSALTQFTISLLPNQGVSGSYLKVSYSDGDPTNPAGLVTLNAQIPVQISPPIVSVYVYLPKGLSTVPAQSSSSPGLLNVVNASLSDSSGASYAASSWDLGEAGLTIEFTGVVDNNLPFSASATVQLQDREGSWFTLMSPSTSAAQVLGSSTPTLALNSGAVGNLSIGSNTLGSQTSGTWLSSWGVNATVGGQSSSFSPRLFASSGAPTLTGVTLTGSWPSYTQVTLSPPNSAITGSFSVPIYFDNGAPQPATGTVSGAVTPSTGSGSGSIG